MPFISVIVPNYNHAQYLHERMNSILSQTFQDFEIILLDDCSNDDSNIILESYSRHEKVSCYVHNSVNSGSPFKQWEKGINLAKGEWIWIAESDDIAELSFLEELVFLANQYPTAGLVFSHLKWIDSKSRLISSQEETDSVFYDGDSFISRNLAFSTTIFNVSSCIFRRNVYNRISSRMFVNYRYAGDYMFYVQMAGLCDVVECGHVLDSYRQHESNTTKAVGAQAFLQETVPIITYIINHHRVHRLIFALTYARYLFNVNFSKSDKISSVLALGKSCPSLLVVYPAYWIYRKTKIAHLKDFLSHKGTQNEH